MLCTTPGLRFPVFVAHLNLLSFRDPREGGYAGTLASVFCPDHLKLSCPGPLREHPSQSVPHGHRDTITGFGLVPLTTKAGDYPC